MKPLVTNPQRPRRKNRALPPRPGRIAVALTPAKVAPSKPPMEDARRRGGVTSKECWGYRPPINTTPRRPLLRRMGSDRAGITKPVFHLLNTMAVRGSLKKSPERTLK